MIGRRIPFWDLARLASHHRLGHAGDEITTIIDRETRNPFPRRFSSKRALQSLIKAKQRQGRDGVSYSEANTRAMLKAYYQGCSELWFEKEHIFVEKTLGLLS